MLHSHATASSFAPDKSSNGNRIHADFESLFTEFLMRKEFWPWLQKVGQRPTRFPFSDIHGWEGNDYTLLIHKIVEEIEYYLYVIFYQKLMVRI